ncbi:rod-binding protein [Sulfitobacter geojensis]|uniref:rod-binding protein n=1 Tax=Sulfitobacter geojensis TaxID=1342299 RepID=UPI0007DA0CEE|nr:rod-binding protein [Sulfitobacter geojensis]OAN96220.1 chemotaxis protein chel [Sulfitobacter geojensis]
MEAIRPVVAPTSQPQGENALRDAAMQLEANFLGEMLKSAGLGASPDGFGGGPGEDQFASFLVAEQAMAMVRAGGIGLSESIYEALKERNNDGKE